MNEIFTRTYNIEQKMAGGNNAAPIASASAGTATDPQIRAYLEGIQNDIRQIRSSQLANTGGAAPLASCPDANCATSTILFLIILVQTCVILGFVFMR